MKQELLNLNKSYIPMLNLKKVYALNLIKKK